MNIEIEKGIPIHSYSKKAVFDDLLSRMEVGDSVLMKSQTDVQQCRTAATKQNKKVSSRITKNDPGYAFRVWRTE